MSATRWGQLARMEVYFCRESEVINLDAKVELPLSRVGTFRLQALARVLLIRSDDKSNHTNRGPIGRGSSTCAKTGGFVGWEWP